MNKLKTLFAIALTFPFIVNSSCNSTTDCNINKVTLTDFYQDTNVPNIAVDPLGGYIFLYWIDSNGNVCHGEPGVNAQPGPIVISAFSQEAYTAAQSNSVFTEDQLRQYQDYIYSNANYHVSGFHFAQFDNVIWRSRSDGKVFMDRMNHYFSKPVIVNVENAMCLRPVYSSADQQCGRYTGIMIPSVVNGGQHPTIGLSRTQPLNNSLSDAELMNYCVTKLPHGLEIVE